MSDIEKAKEALKPCPICGSRAGSQAGRQYKIMLQDWHDVDEALYQPNTVKCSVCGLAITRAACNAEHGGANGAQREAKRLAIIAWNTRAALEEKPPEDISAFIDKVEQKLKDYCFDAWTFNNEQKQYMGEWDSDTARAILTDAFNFFDAAYHARECAKCRELGGRA